MTTFRLDAGGQTLALAVTMGLPEVIYWGARLPADENLDVLAQAGLNDVTGGMLDALPSLSLTPEAGRAFQGQPGLVLSDADGTPLLPAFHFDHAETAPNHLRLISHAGDLTLTHDIRASTAGILTLQTELTSGAPIRLHWLAAPVLPAPQLAGHMIDVSGKWTREFALNHVPWTPGIRLRESRTGRSGHEHPPYLILPETGCTNTQGTAFALHYGWSGGHRMVAEELPDGRRQIQFGHAAGAETEPGQHFQTAPLYAAFSTTGLNGIGTAYQHHIRDDIVQWPN